VTTPTASPPMAPARIPIKASTSVLSTSVALPRLDIDFPSHVALFYLAGVAKTNCRQRLKSGRILVSIKGRKDCSNHGTTVRYLRQEAAIGKPHQPRPQCYKAALECELAPSTRPCWRNHQAHAGLHLLHAQRQSHKSLINTPLRPPRINSALTGSRLFLGEVRVRGANKSPHCTPSN
jgi:hypothetical protein